MNGAAKKAPRGQRHVRRWRRRALLCIAAVAVLTLSVMDLAIAENSWGNSKTPWANSQNSWGRAPSPKSGNGWPNAGTGKRSNFSGYKSVPAEGIVALPAMEPRGGDYIDTGAIPDGLQAPSRPPKRTARYRPSSAPAADEKRFIADEVVVEIANSLRPQAIGALQRRHQLTFLQSQTSPLSGTTRLRLRMTDPRPVAALVRALEADATINSAQPNYLFTLLQSEAKAGNEKSGSENDPEHYASARLRLPQAHRIVKGENILVAVIDSAVDVTHPALAGKVTRTLNTGDTPSEPHKHGTALAGLIAGHGRLTSAAPAAHILAICAFETGQTGEQGNTFDILKAIDWAAANGARVINMSFSGPADPAIHRSLAGAAEKGIVLVAAAGNAGPKSPPLFPANDPNVIAVSATDIDNKSLAQSTRGRHIALAAPGGNILVAIPGGGYEVSSDSSYAAAEVSGIVALMLASKPNLSPAQVRGRLQTTAKDIGPKGRDDMFGAGLIDALGAITAEELRSRR